MLRLSYRRMPPASVRGVGHAGPPPQAATATRFAAACGPETKNQNPDRSAPAWWVRCNRHGGPMTRTPSMLLALLLMVPGALLTAQEPPAKNQRAPDAVTNAMPLRIDCGCPDGIVAAGFFAGGSWAVNRAPGTMKQKRQQHRRRARHRTSVVGCTYHQQAALRSGVDFFVSGPHARQIALRGACGGGPAWPTPRTLAGGIPPVR